MTGLEIVLTVAVVWLAGALAAVLIEERYRADEHLALAFWFVIVPLGVSLRAYRRWRFTCRDCDGYYGDRERYERHLVHRYHCTVPPAEGVDPNDYTVPNGVR